MENGRRAADPLAQAGAAPSASNHENAVQGDRLCARITTYALPRVIQRCISLVLFRPLGGPGERVFIR